MGVTPHNLAACSFLVVIAGLVCLRATPDAGAPISRSPALTSFETVRVADGVYTFVAPETLALVSGNSTAILGEEGVLVVDTGHFPTATRRMIAEIRRLTDKPVRFVINTHWHPDHHSGNFVYREEFPGVAIISTEYTRQQIEKQSRKFDQPEGLTATIRVLREQLAGGKKRNGSPLSAQDREFLEVVIAEMEQAIPELRLVKPLRPTIGFEQRLNIHLGKRDVEVMFLGRGNTGGDAVVYIPQAKVLITGDLLVAPTPYAYGSFFSDWIQTLRKLRGMEASAIVPGHGPVEHEKRYLDLVENLLQSTLEQSQAAAQRGLSLEETRTKIDLERFRKQLTGDHNLRNHAFEEGFLKPGIGRAWREAKQGSLSDED